MTRTPERALTTTGAVVQCGENAWELLKDADPLHAITWLADAAVRLREATDEAVALARQEGATWDAIGRAANVTRQAATQRWARGRDL